MQHHSYGRRPPISPSHPHNPYPFYTQLRIQGPLSQLAWRGGNMWLVTSYDDAVTLLKDLRLTMDWQKVACLICAWHMTLHN